MVDKKADPHRFWAIECVIGSETVYPQGASFAVASLTSSHGVVDFYAAFVRVYRQI